MPIDAYFRLCRLAIARDQLESLPRPAGYKVEYVDGEAWITPTAACVTPVLRLSGEMGLPAREDVRRLGVDDWEALGPIFVVAFRRVAPFASLGEGEAEAALHECLHATRAGEDGPLVEPACLVATRPDGLAGGLITTMIRRGGREVPHLTWIFVRPLERRRGVASALLRAAADELLALGYDELASTSLIANVPSLLWHWRQGFRLDDTRLV